MASDKVIGCDVLVIGYGQQGRHNLLLNVGQPKEANLTPARSNDWMAWGDGCITIAGRFIDVPRVSSRHLWTVAPSDQTNPRAFSEFSVNQRRCH